jgi:hypothetical protein
LHAEHVARRFAGLSPPPQQHRLDMVDMLGGGAADPQPDFSKPFFTIPVGKLVFFGMRHPAVFRGGGLGCRPSPFPFRCGASLR